ncbi:hypothetical protein WMF39_02395 [Sorangium sp. So ce1504]|uniref:hypothetical protein n=1 Tax=Sorangium sp. So ce1504 TaxID=3133337 RepID=UPI003F628661
MRSGSLLGEHALACRVWKYGQESADSFLDALLVTILSRHDWNSVTTEHERAQNEAEHAEFNRLREPARDYAVERGLHPPDNDRYTNGGVKRHPLHALLGR